MIVASAGGIEEDFIKCLAPTFLGDFHKYSGKDLRTKCINRIGNLLVPNSNYCKFEDWIIPIFDQMLKEQKEQVSTLKFDSVWSCSPLVTGAWCNLPILCPDKVVESLEVLMFIS